MTCARKISGMSIQCQEQKSVNAALVRTRSVMPSRHACPGCVVSSTLHEFARPQKLFADYSEEHAPVVLVIPITRPVAQTKCDVDLHVGTADPSRRHGDLNIKHSQVMIVPAGELRDEPGQDSRRLHYGYRHGHGGSRDARAATRKRSK